MSHAHEPANSSEPVALTNRDDPTPRTGFVILAGVLMLTAGASQVMGGIVALLDDSYYGVTENRLAIPVSYTAWGWTHLVIGVVVVLTGLGVLLGRNWARAVAVVLAVVSALLNMTFLKAYPVGSTMVVVFDLLVIYALVAHGPRTATDSVRATGGPIVERPVPPFIRIG